MPRFLKVGLLVIGGLLILCVLIIIVFAYRLDLRIDDEFISKKFDNTEITAPRYVVDQPFSYLDNRVESDLTIVFVHGAPGSARDFSEFMKLSEINSYRLICYERRGYGYFDYGSVDKDILSQGKELNQFLKKLDLADNVILVGHSYGAAVVMAAAAMDQDDRIGGVLLAAGLMSSELEKIFWFNPFFNLSGVRAILPKFARMANDEKMSHAESLKEVEGLWDQVKCPVYVLHGDKDWIAPVENAHYLDSILSDHPEYHLEILPEGDHILQMNAKAEIVKGIEWLVSHALIENTRDNPLMETDHDK